MEQAEFALLMAAFGAMGLSVAALNVFALRVVRIDDVPRSVQARIRWWCAHNTTFLLACAALTVVSLGALAIS